MNRIRTLALPVAALCAVFAIAGCKKEAPKPPVSSVPATTVLPPAPATLAPPPPAAPVAEVARVDLGSSVGSDLRVPVPKTTFAPTDRIMASVVTRAPDAATGTSTKLTARWTHVDSNQTVNEESRDIELKGEQVFGFEIKNPGAWPTGKYRLEVLLDDKPAQSRDFEVK